MIKPKLDLKEPTKENFCQKIILETCDSYNECGILSFKDIKKILPPNINLEDVFIEEYHHWDEHVITYFYLEKFDENLYNERKKEYDEAVSIYNQKMNDYKNLKKEQEINNLKKRLSELENNK